MKIKKGDNIKVLTGKDAGKTGKVESVFPDKNRAVVSGINIVVKHQKPTRGAKQVGRINMSLPIDLSNIALICDKCAKSVRVGYKVLEDGRKIRVCKKCGDQI